MISSLAAEAQSLPTITSISPNQRTVNSGGFTLTLTGTQFCSDVNGGSTISFNGVSRAATTPSDTSASANILASEMTVAGPVSVTLTENNVRTCPTGGATSAPVTFTINPPLVLNPPTLPNATVGFNYSQTLSASGGTPPYSTPTPTGASVPPFTNSPGTVTFNFTPANPANYNFNVPVTDSGGGSINPAYAFSAARPTLTILSGSPQGATVNTAFATPMRVRVTNANGFSMFNAPVLFTAPGSGASGSFSGSTTVLTDDAGTATAPTFTANSVAGSYQVIASLSGATAAFSLTNTAGPPSQISATGGTPQSAAVNTMFATALQATVRDAFNNLAAGVAVDFTAPGSGASGAFAGKPTVITNAAGVATAPAFTANSVVGGYQVIGSIPGASAAFNLTNTAGPPAAIVPTAGTPQSATIGTVFATALQATVRDAFGNLVSGAPVTFTPSGGAASGSFSGSATVSTNASGVATAPPFTANLTAGSYTVTASSGAATPASFSLTNKTGAPASVTAVSGGGQSAQVNTNFGSPLVVVVKDAGGNLVQNATVSYNPPNSGASALLLGNQNVVTNSSGIATSPALQANSVAGDYTVAAAVAGASPALFALTNTSGPAITTTALPAGSIGDAYSAGLAASGGSPPYTFSIQAGALPPGLTLSSAGAIAGTPTAAGSFTILAKVADSIQASSTKELTIRVVAGLTITTGSSLPNSFIGQSYSITFQATGGQPLYTWAVVGGNLAAAEGKGRAAAASGLPPGLTFNGATGTLSGTPTALGDYIFGIQVTDAGGRTAGKTFTLTTAPSSGAPAIKVSVTDLDFDGPSGGNPPAPQYLSVTAANLEPLGATIDIDSGNPGTPAPPWLSARFTSATTPARLAISTDQSGLAAGDYVGRVLVHYQGLQTLIVNVRFHINLTPPKLAVGPSYLRYGAITGGVTSFEQALLVSNAGTGGAIDFTATVTKGAWLTVTPGSGKTVVGGAVPLRVLVNTQGLKIGSYLGQVRVQSPVGGTVNVPVSLFVSPDGPIIGVSPLGYRIDSREGNGLGSSREITLLNQGTGTVNWTAELQTGQGWLKLTPGAGQSTPEAPGKVTVTVEPGQLKAGPYYGLIRFSDPQALNSPQVGLVVLNVRAASATPEADLTPAGVSFTAVAGGAAPAAQTVKVYVSSDDAAAFQAAASADDGGDWLTIDKAKGTASTATPGLVAISVNPAKLKPGVYTGDVTFSFSTPGIRTENVTLVVLPPGAAVAAAGSKERSATSNCTPAKLALTSTSLANAFASPAGWPTPLLVQATDDCGNPAANARVVATFSNGDPVLSLSLVNPGGAVFSGTWAPAAVSQQMSVKLTGVAQGLATASLNLTGSVGGNAAPRLDNNGFVNNLNPDSAGGALAPGTVAQIFGAGLTPVTQEPGLIPLPKVFNDAQVLIGLQPAPLYYVSGRQMNVQIPTELQPDRQYSILVSSGAAFTLPDTITITSVSPGLLQFAQHADFSTITSAAPIVPGETMRLYLVGMGATDQTVASGDASPGTPPANVNAQPAVSIGGKPASVRFAGLTPGLVGLYQIDLDAPADLPSGPATVTVTQGDTTSNAVTLPVR